MSEICSPKCFLPESGCIPCTNCKLECTRFRKCIHYYYRMHTNSSSRFLQIECKLCNKIIHTHNDDDFSPTYSEFLKAFRKCTENQAYFKCISKKHKTPMIEHREIINLDNNAKSSYLSIFCNDCCDWVDTKRIKSSENAKESDISSHRTNVVVIKSHFFFANVHIKECAT